MSEASIDVVGNLTELADLFVDVATGDPLSPLLVAAGGLLLAVSLGAMGYLTAGAVLTALLPRSPGEEHGQRG